MSGVTLCSDPGFVFFSGLAQQERLRMHCCLTWLGKMVILKQSGLNASSVLKEWNRTCTKNAQLVGSKSTALLNVLDLEQRTIDLLLKHVSEFGSDKSAFSETIWATKKVMPGGCPRGFSRDWNSRLTMTSDGFHLLIQYVDTRHRNKLPGARCKVGNQEMEDCALVSQLLVSLVNDIEKQLPVSPRVLEDEVFSLFLQGDLNLETQLQGALSEKKTGLVPGDIPALKGIMQRHVAGSEQKLAALGRAPAGISAGQIEKQEWDMALASMKQDLDVFQVWLNKSRDREGAVYHQNLQWRLTRVTKAREVASTLVANKSDSCLYHFLPCDTAADVSKEISLIQRRLMRLEQLQTDNLLTVSILNWAAPNLYTAQVQRVQAAVMGGLCGHIVGTNVGIYLTPTFTFSRGQLHSVEQACSKLLMGSNLNLDHVVVLHYQGRNDDREKRPLVQVARLCVSMDAEAHQNQMEVWRGASVLRKPLLDEAELLPTKEMLTIEDLSETALPSTTSDVTHPSQAEKAQQCGVSAARSILRSFLSREGSNSGQRMATLVVDLSPHTLDFARAVATERGNNPIFYVGFCRPEDVDWSRAQMTEFLKDGFLDGSLKLPPSCSIPAAQPPEELQESASLPLPTLNSFVINKSVKIDGLPTLKTPDKLLTTWAEHPRFSTEFKEFLEEARLNKPLDVPASIGSEVKREGDRPNPVSKKPKTDATGNTLPPSKEPVTDAIQLGELPTPLTWEAEIYNKKTGPNLVVTLGARVFVVNRGDRDTTLEKNTVLAGFYKGKWFQSKDSSSKKAKTDGEAEEQSQNNILFALSDASTCIQMNGRMTTLGACMKEKRKMQPDASVSYHTLVDSPITDNPAHFKCELKHSIYWSVLDIPKDAKTCVKNEDGKFTVPSHHIASVIPHERWEGWASSIIWSCKWSPTAAKGLQPCRPLVVLTRSITLAANTAVELTSGPQGSAPAV